MEASEQGGSKVKARWKQGERSAVALPGWWASHAANCRARSLGHTARSLMNPRRIMHWSECWPATRYSAAGSLHRPLPPMRSSKTAEYTTTTGTLRACTTSDTRLKLSRARADLPSWSLRAHLSGCGSDSTPTRCSTARGKLPSWAPRRPPGGLLRAVRVAAEHVHGGAERREARDAGEAEARGAAGDLRRGLQGGPAGSRAKDCVLALFSICALRHCAGASDNTCGT